MKKIVLLCLYLLPIVSFAQPLYRPPFLTYIGTTAETSKLMMNGLPYDGVGKEVLLEQLPDTWVSGFMRFDLPSHLYSDAYGAISPKFIYSGRRHNFGAQLDRYGNLSAETITDFDIYPLNYSMRGYLQLRHPSDLNKNGLTDFYAGNKLYLNPGVSFFRNNWDLKVNALYLHNDEWGGSMLYVSDTTTTSDGFSRKTDHLQTYLSAAHTFGKNKDHTIDISFDMKQHWQSRELFHQDLYRINENVAMATAFYTKKFKFSNLSGGVHYTRDTLRESIDDFKNSTGDSFWRLFGNSNSYLTEWAVLKTVLNFEKHRQQKAIFLPNVQIDVLLGKKTGLTLSGFGSTGQRLLKPIHQYYNYMVYADTLIYSINKFQRAKRGGIALSYAERKHNRFNTTLNADVTEYNDFINSFYEQNQLHFVNSGSKFKRLNVEWVGNIYFGKESNMFLQAIYRWEHPLKSNVFVTQDNHFGQLRAQFTKGIWVLNGHYIARTYGNTPELWHRLDLMLDCKPVYGNKPEWLRHFSATLRFDNVNELISPSKKPTNNPYSPLFMEALWQPSLPNIRLQVNMHMG